MNMSDTPEQPDLAPDPACPDCDHAAVHQELVRLRAANHVSDPLPQRPQTDPAAYSCGCGASAGDRHYPGCPHRAAARATVSDHDKLIGDLVSERWRWLYHTNPQFHNDVRNMADLLPAWVDALAMRSSPRDREIAQEMERVLDMPPPLTRRPFSD